MLGFMHGLGHLAVHIWHSLIGTRLDTGWGIAALTYTAIVAVAFLIGGCRSVAEAARAFDLGYDKEELERRNWQRPDGTDPRVINWKLARKQQVRSPRFTIPFGMMVMATLYWWVREPFNLRSYVIVAVCWMIGLMIIRPWWIWTELRTQRKLIKTGEATAEELPYARYSLRQAMSYYFAWGLQNSLRRRQAFIGRLRFLNPVVNLIGLRWLKVKLLRPLVICAFYASLWTITLPIGVFYLDREFDERRHFLRPEWANKYADKPRSTEGIPDTPGDARAAAS